MTSIINNIVQSYNYLFDELCDDRTRDWFPGVGNLAIILLSYIYFCKKAGPEWMKNRKPFDLTNIIFVYNIFQIIISTYIFYEASKVFIAHHNPVCQPVVYEDTPLIRKTHFLVWIYANLKLVELLDTVFFVLRKKSRQISSLHLYHHFMMPICAFLGLKYFPNGHSMSLGLVNCFVHMIMYTYYLIAGMGPQYQKILWWKKYVTILQLVQFGIIFIHNLMPLLTDCPYPRWINIALCINSTHFVYMFGNFYYVNYIKTTTTTENDSEKIK